MKTRLRVEVIHADASGATRIVVELPEAGTVADALRTSAIVERVGLDADSWSVGVFGKRVAMTRPLVDGDRVELYRPLLVDPGDARRRRAEARVRDALAAKVDDTGSSRSRG